MSEYERWTEEKVAAHNARIGAKMPAHFKPSDVFSLAQLTHSDEAGISTAPPKAAKRAKFGNKKTLCGGILFDSGHEADIYLELKAQLELGDIKDLELQPRYGIFACELATGKGIEVASFKADFRYFDIRENRVRVKDAKSEGTKHETAYRLRKKLVEACHGITIEEV